LYLGENTRHNKLQYIKKRPILRQFFCLNIFATFFGLSRYVFVGQVPQGDMMKKVLILSLLIVSSCAKKSLDETSTSVDANTAETESALTAVSGTLDEQSGSSFSTYKSEKSHLFSLLINQSQASECMRPVFASCSSSVRTMDYVGCSLGSSSKTLSGQASLTYSNPSCVLSADGDSVTRTYDISISGPRGGVITLGSAVKSDYRGTSYGGGGRITQTASGHDLDILGKHKVLSFKGINLYDVSIRTLAPLQITGGLSRSARNIVSGQLEINHNKAERTAVWTFNNLQYSSSCCHPVSGSIDIAWTGSKVGTGQINFQGCGIAELTEDGQSQSIEMSYCE